MSRIWLVCLAAFAVGGAGLYAASRRVEPVVRRGRLVKYVTYLLIVNLVLLATFVGRTALTAIIAVIAALGTRELASVLRRASGGRAMVAAGMVAVYLSITSGALLFAWQTRPVVAAGVYLLVCLFDGFSQVSGQLLGRHRLAPALSPGKTTEGSLGGLLFAVATALLLRPELGWSGRQSLAAAVWIAASALSGDLLASWVKRRCGVKDFGTLLPGHGGILDRFDSFLFVAATWALVTSMARVWDGRSPS